MPATAAAILDGMPDARDLHRLDSGGQIMIFAGPMLLFRYCEADTPARNLAVAVLRQLRFSGTAVAGVTELTPNYVATLNQRFLKEGTAGLIRALGRPRETSGASWDQASGWRAGGVRDAEIARRLGVNQSTVLRRLGPAHLREAPQPRAAAGPQAAGPQATEPQATEPQATEPRATEPGAAPARPAVIWSRYAGAMLLHAFFARCAAGTVLAAAGEPQDVRLLTGISMCFALGASTPGQFKHLAAAEAGPLAGPGTLPGLRALRPALAQIADRTDPLQLQSLFAAAMLAADPVTSGVYYAGDHFIPCTGARPVAKGRDSKRGRAGRGHAGTHVTAHDGRAVCFVSGEPSGLPVTYRRAPLAVPAMLPVITTVTHGGRTREICWAEETVQIKDYGDARQITLSGHGQVALQILTSDTDACPADILSWLKSRWREENFLKYASENYGIDKICDYLAGITQNTKLTRNPPGAPARGADNALASAERDLAALLAGPALTAAAKNARIPGQQKAITRARSQAARSEERRVGKE